jgi:hypothetical protein
MFSTELAPPPEPGNMRKRLFDPAPGKVLRAARVLLDASQDAVAKQANLAHTTIRRLVRSECPTRTSLSASVTPSDTRHRNPQAGAKMGLANISATAAQADATFMMLSAVPARLAPKMGRDYSQMRNNTVPH